MKKSVLQTLAVLIVMIFSALGVVAQEAPRASIDISKHPYKGPANAAVVMVVFSDYL